MKVRHKEPLESIMNASINEVLSRTIITSVTVLLTSGALFFSEARLYTTLLLR